MWRTYTYGSWKKIQKDCLQFNFAPTLLTKEKETTNINMTNDIFKIIEINLDAKAAYQILNDSNREKKDAARTKVSADIIKHELRKKFFFDAKRLKELAEQISQCIPGEIKETYYVPYKKLLNKKSNAKGKLYDKYLNFLRSLRNNGLAPLSRNMIETQTASNIFENIKGQLKWLSIHKEPFEDVKAGWETTHEARYVARYNTKYTCYF
ncbi:hypothetical protein ACFW04_012726 [Cataglyphis niger]